MSIFSILFDHHIIPESCRDHTAFRGIDQQTFDIGSPANRIYLPANRELAAKLNVSPHPGGHIGPYRSNVCRKLDQITKIESPAERLSEIKTLIDAMRVGFLNGHLYTNVPNDKTREEIVPWIEKIVTNPKAYLDQYPDQLRTIRDVERRGVEVGQDHLIKWLPYLDHPEREKLIDEEIARNPDVNLTAGNRDLRGTKWSKFAPVDDDFQVPPTTPASPRDIPLPPPFFPPFLGWLSEPEGFRPSDRRFTGALPAFPTPDPGEQRLGQLPPTTATPAAPFVLQSDPYSGVTSPYYENPLAGGASPERDILPWLAGAAGVAVAAPFTPAWLLGIMAVLALTRAATAGEGNSGPATGTAAPNGGVFSTGAPSFNTIGTGLNVDDRAGNSGASASSSFARQLDGASSTDPATRAGTFADRFGDWGGTNGSVPDETVDPYKVPDAPARGSVAPENVRRLTQANEANAGSVFSSGSAPVPYLPSTEFNERFGNWTFPTADSGQPPPSKPVGTFAGEPSHLIAPPIFGVDGPGNPRKDTVDWLSRWIGPLLPPE